MCIVRLSKNLIDLAVLRRNEEVSQQRGNILRREITHTLVIKQFENTEDELVESLSPVFKKQIKQITDGLFGIEEKTYQEDAHVLTSLYFNPHKWDKEVTNKTLPILALNMARAGVTQMLVFGIDVLKSASFNQKQTTASEWLENNPDDFDELLETFEGTVAGTTANIRFMAGLPLWMKQAIMEELAVSFSQDYWRNISVTTQKDAEEVLRQGLVEGWSIRKMTKELKGSLGGDAYAKVRATKIARTEASGALNSVRKTTMDQFVRELGPDIPMRPSWLSVLSDATRDSHANLDGVPADEEGLWNLDGVEIPWPGHYTLPPENRVNCMCTILAELGVSDTEARRLIQEHELRVQETNGINQNEN